MSWRLISFYWPKATGVILKGKVISLATLSDIDGLWQQSKQQHGGVPDVNLSNSATNSTLNQGCIWYKMHITVNIVKSDNLLNDT